jgi:hypothetical protein
LVHHGPHFSMARLEHSSQIYHGLYVFNLTHFNFISNTTLTLSIKWKMIFKQSICDKKKICTHIIYTFSIVLIHIIFFLSLFIILISVSIHIFFVNLWLFQKFYFGCPTLNIFSVALLIDKNSPYLFLNFQALPF